jgi:F420-dependent oxidoreductase-like protein
MVLRFPSPSLILLVGPSGAGKSTWAEQNFREGQVLSTDHFRAFIGHGPSDQSASARAFELVEQILAERLDQRRLTVIDTLGLNRAQRRRHIAMARERDIPVFALGFDTPPDVCKTRNDARGRPIPVKVHAEQLKRWVVVRDAELADDGFDGIHVLESLPPARTVPVSAWTPGPSHPSARLRFGMTLAQFPWPDDEIAAGVAALARRAEDVGFDSFWVMDHLRQIPQVGRPWDPLPEAYTTLAYAAGLTDRIRLGTLVTAIGYRNVGLLAKILASLDVLSGGRAIAGLGAGWFEAEAAAYGYDWERDGLRLDMLEDALQALPLIWGPGNAPYEGKRVSLPETLCYPRPIQDRIPILVGGGGERRTLRLVARHADATNLMGPPDVIRHKLAVLHAHCAEVGRDPEEIEVTVLTTGLVAETALELDAKLAAVAGARGDKDALAASLGAGLVEDQITRLNAYADVGVDTIILGPVAVTDPDDLEPYRALIDAYA